MTDVAQSASPTFDDRLVETRGHPAGFDYLRLFLATEVLVWQTILISYGITIQDIAWNASAFRAIPALILPMFFSLSGFLVSGSLERAKNIFSFLCLRVLRIVPAFWTVIILSALVMGPLVTAYAMPAYFADGLFVRYFLSMLGAVQDHLPGVFEANPFRGEVNGQFWTIPLEMMCYAILAVFALVGIYRRPALFLTLILIVQFLFGLRVMFGTSLIWSGVPRHILFLCFLFGALFHVYRRKILHHWYFAVLCGILSVGSIYVTGGGYFLAAPVAYLTIYLGLLNPCKTVLVSSGDYSYGIYLYAFPIQQLMASLGPWANHWYMNLMLSLPAAFFAAFLSWHLLEKRALALRKNIPAIDSCLSTLRTNVISAVLAISNRCRSGE